MPAVETSQPPQWATSAFGLPPSPSSTELNALCDHLRACRHDGRLTAVHCAATSVRSFVSGHLVTSAVVIAVATGAVWLAI